MPNFDSQTPLSYLGSDPAVQPPLVVADRDPTSSDNAYDLGTRWLNKSSQALFDLVADGTWNSGGNAAASETVAGIAELATTAEAVAGTDDARIMTPKKVADVFAAPPELGSGTPAAVSATTVTGSGDIETTAGNVVISGAGNHVQIETGAVTDFAGTGTLASGTVTIANTNIAAGDLIFLQRIDINGSSAIGNLTYSISAATSFTVTSVSDASPGSTETNDVSNFAYWIVRPL